MISRNLLHKTTYRRWRMKTFLGLALFLFILPGISAAAVQTKIYQCANYKAGMGDHDTCESWINGNINEQKAFYFEGDVVAYRLHLKGLTVGHSYTATIEWDGTQGDKNALDYITTVNRTIDNADPCQDLTISGGCDKDIPDDTWLIPVDAEVEKGRDQIDDGGYPNGDDIAQETPHYFRMWNGDITAVGPYSYDPISFDYLSSTKISTSITFTANAADVLMAWGGHISTRQDWGDADSAINISGSPYHMRLLTVVDHDDGDDIVASGNRDLQLSASAVFFPISLTIEKTTDRDTSDWFDFTTNLVSPDDAFSLQKNSTNTLVIGASTIINVTESDPGSLWDLDSITCMDLSQEPPVVQAHTPINGGMGASLNLDEGAIAKCTFHNIFTGEPLLVVEKKVIVEGGDCGTVNFDESSTNELLEIASGDTVKYCYRVKNTGDAAAYNLALEDDAAGLSAPFSVALSGGNIATLDGVGTLNDLDVDGQTFGEALVAINEPTGTLATNTATADADDPAEPVSDTAQVEVVDQADCTVTATVTTGACPGLSNTIDVIEETSVTWCAEICWPGNANSSLTIGATGVELLDGNEDPLDPAITSGPFTIEPGTCATASLPETLTDSVDRILKAAGSDGFENNETCQATAAADVYNPDIDIDKKVSLDATCGNGDDADSLEVYTGTDVWYCFTVSNDHEGAEGLSSVQFNDALLSLVDVTVGYGSLASGEVWNSTAYGPYSRDEEVSNTATVDGEGALTGTPVSDSDTAIVTVVTADVIVEKSGTSALDVEQGESDIEYVIFVWNDGTTTAIDVELTDALPENFVYGSNDSGCSYDAGDHDLTCEMGDIEPGLINGTTINVYGALAVDSGYDPLVNEACAYPDNNLTPDVNLSNNCDDTTTRITTGATRTIGWWGNHPDMMGACLEANDDLIEVLGFVELATVENAIGIIKTNIAHDLCKEKRDPLVKAQLQAGRQVLAAFCNVNYLGAAEPAWMDDAQAILEGDDIAEILTLGGQADEFNNSGDEEPLPIGISPEHANPHFEWTDPTSPEECMPNNNGNGNGNGNGPKSGEGSGGGCMIGRRTGFDPLLPLMVMIAVAYLWCRRRENT